jgi:beta-glucosidase
MTERILRGMIQSGVWDGEPGGCVLGCDCSPSLYEANATSPAHDALAIEVAADAVVLLKNEGGVLPLRPNAKVALVGHGCTDPHRLDPHGWGQASDYSVVGGSGRVITTPDRAPSIEQSLARRGVLRLNASRSDGLEEALAVAEGADVVIACAGGTATEAVDRASLALDQQQLLLALGPALRSRGVPLVVVAMAPGQIEAPWANDTAAAAVMFLGGQGTGEAWARILMGEVAPSGKLPVTLPYHETDMLPPCEQSECVYRDALRFGWTALLGTRVAFAFGHGLSYSDFAYAWAPAGAPTYTRGEHGNSSSASLSVVITNVGAVDGRETVQLYLTFPANASGTTAEPRMLLRAFEKTPVLQPAGTHVAAMLLSARDLSIWDAAVGPRGGWRLVTGKFMLMVGSSSRDPRLEVPLWVT